MRHRYPRPLAADAQQNKSIPRIGVLWHAGSAEEEAVYLGALVQGLQDLGYVDGRNTSWSIVFLPNSLGVSTVSRLNWSG